MKPSIKANMKRGTDKSSTGYSFDSQYWLIPVITRFGGSSFKSRSGDEGVWGLPFFSSS